MSKDELISLLKDRVKNLSKELPIRLAMLFGSYAINRYTVASDVDIFAVVENKDKDKIYRKIYEGLGISNLQLHLYTVDEYEKLKMNRPSFVKEIEEKGILIFKV
ncbi:MAG: nucleotidyltransferase domain-containing protein [Nitrososphaerales archaeon]